MRSDVTEKEVLLQLKTVIDPELGVDIVSLGLIYSITIHDKIEVEMTLTTPGCPLAPFFQEQVPAVIEQGCNVDDEDIILRFTFDPPWTQEMMQESAKLALGLL